MNANLKTILRLDPFKFLFWNFISSKVKRDKGAYILTFKGSVLNVGRDARIVLHKNLLLNNPKMGRSREEMYLLIREGGKLTINGITAVASRSTLQVQKGASLAIGRSVINHEATIISGCSIDIGDDTLISRKVTIFDSDFHKIIDELGYQTNDPKPVNIGNHVWIGAGATILRGSKIGDGAVISAGSVVMGKIKEGTTALGYPARSFSNVNWES